MSNTVNKVLSKTPVYTGMQVLRIINSLVQSNLIGKGEKEYMTDLVSEGMKNGNFTEIHEYALLHRRENAAEKMFFDRITALLQKED